MPARARRCWWLVLCHAMVLAPADAANAADVANCLKVVARAGSDAVLVNRCSQRLNAMYCIEGAPGVPRCADKPKQVITLFPGASTVLSGHDGQAGSVHWAVCIYPEAPVDWDPGPDRPYACKKTCVMC